MYRQRRKEKNNKSGVDSDGKKEKESKKEMGRGRRRKRVVRVDNRQEGDLEKRGRGSRWQIRLAAGHSKRKT